MSRQSKAQREEKTNTWKYAHIANIYAMCLCTGTLCLLYDCAIRIRISFDLFGLFLFFGIVAVVVVVAFVGSIKYSETDDIWIDLFFISLQLLAFASFLPTRFHWKSFWTCTLFLSLYDSLHFFHLFIFSLCLFLALSLHLMHVCVFSFKNLTNKIESLPKKGTHTRIKCIYVEVTCTIHAMNAWTDALQTYRLLSLSSSSLPSFRLCVFTLFFISDFRHAATHSAIFLSICHQLKNWTNEKVFMWCDVFNLRRRRRKHTQQRFLLSCTFVIEINIRVWAFLQQQKQNQK